MAQLAQLLDQQLFHLVGGLERTLRGVRQIKDALESHLQIRMLPESLDELGFLDGEFRTAKGLFHPNSIATSG